MFATVLAPICTHQIAKGSLCITDNWTVQQKSRNIIKCRVRTSAVCVKYSLTYDRPAITKDYNLHVPGCQNPAADHGGKDEYRHCGEVQADRDSGRGNCQVSMEVRKICRLHEWPIASSYMFPNEGGGIAPHCGVSANEYSCAHGAQIYFGDLTPCLTYEGRRS